MLLHEKLLLDAKVFAVACDVAANVVAVARGVASANCCVVAALLMLLLHY